MLPARALEHSPSFSCSFSRPSLLPSPDCPPCSHTQAPLGPYRVLFSPRYQLLLGWDGVQGTREPLACSFVCCCEPAIPGGTWLCSPTARGASAGPQPRQRQGGAPGTARVRLCAPSFLGWECLRLAWEASGQRGGLCGVASGGRPCLRRPRRGPSPQQGCLSPLTQARPHQEPLPTFAESLGLRMWGARPPLGGSVQGPPGFSAWARALQLCHILFSPFRLQTQSR